MPNSEFQINKAVVLLENGEFTAAGTEFGLLLEAEPENIEIQCGFFTAGYWSNRSEFIKKSRSGRERATLLYREWNNFQDVATERNYKECLALRAAMKRLLGQAAGEFRTAFQEEGGQIMDLELLLQLSSCLVTTADYQNAIEILQYGRKIHPDNSMLLLLLGDAFCQSDSGENIERGISAYCDSFLLEHLPTLPGSGNSKPIQTTLDLLNQAFAESKPEDVREWLPAYLLAANFKPELRPGRVRTIVELDRECNRLEQSLSTVAEKFRLKVTARLTFYLLLLLHHYLYSKPDKNRRYELENRLRQTDLKLYEFYNEQKGGANLHL